MAPETLQESDHRHSVVLETGKWRLDSDQVRRKASWGAGSGYDGPTHPQVNQSGETRGVILTARQSDPLPAPK